MLNDIVRVGLDSACGPIYTREYRFGFGVQVSVFSSLSLMEYLGPTLPLPIVVMWRPQQVIVISHKDELLEN